MIKTKNYKGALPYQAPSKNTKTEAIEGGFFYLQGVAPNTICLLKF